jgi:tetratricopeptide (TPR) repeat protein
LLLAQGKAAEAVLRLEAALEIPGYDYAILEFSLAKALQAAGEFDRALEYAIKASNYHDPAEVRLDLQLDQVRALLLQAQLHDQLGDREQARQLAEKFLQQWQQADLPHRDIELARDLAGQ